MCNRTDCAGVFAGELACRVCEEGIEIMKLTHNMRQALIDLDNPLCSASVYWSTSTMKALHARGLVDKRDNGITWSWELRPEGKAYLASSGTSGCAMCDDLKAENAALRTRLAKALWAFECEETYRVCFLNVRYRHNLQPEKYADVRECAMQEMVDILGDAREAIR